MKRFILVASAAVASAATAFGATMDYLGALGSATTYTIGKVVVYDKGI